MGLKKLMNIGFEGFDGCHADDVDNPDRLDGNKLIGKTKKQLIGMFPGLIRKVCAIKGKTKSSGLIFHNDQVVAVKKPCEVDYDSESDSNILAVKIVPVISEACWIEMYDQVSKNINNSSVDELKKLRKLQNAIEVASEVSSEWEEDDITELLDA